MHGVRVPSGGQCTQWGLSQTLTSLETIPAHHISSRQDWTLCLPLRPLSKQCLVFSGISISWTPCPSLQVGGSGEGASPPSTAPATPGDPWEGGDVIQLWNTVGDSSVCVQTFVFLFKGLWLEFLLRNSDTSLLYGNVCAHANLGWREGHKCLEKLGIIQESSL